MGNTYRYDKRGVSATKDEVHQAIKNLDKGLFPNAFCKILPDFAAGSVDHCNIMHADTAGTKTSLAYLYWRETGDKSVWRGIAQDAIVMNLDDMACVGCTDNIILSSTIGRNKNLIPGEVIAEIIEGTVAFVDQMKDYGINIHLAGGETADVGDIVRTIDVGYTAFARLPQSDLIINDIKAGDVIVGFSSYGQSTYEKTYNAGTGSNGLTSARHDLLSNDYATRYPDSFDPNIPSQVVYTGSKNLKENTLINGQEIPFGKLILSPTRTYLPFLQELFKTHRKKINGLIHCTGGGQTKVLKFVQQKRIVKNKLLKLPVLFELIQKESGTDWKEMYQVFNMGHRLEAYVSPNDANYLIQLATEFGIEAGVVGFVENSEKTELEIESPFGNFKYT